MVHRGGRLQITETGQTQRPHGDEARGSDLGGWVCLSLKRPPITTVIRHLSCVSPLAQREAKASRPKLYIEGTGINHAHRYDKA